VPSLQILERFRDEREALLALALLITGNIGGAEGAVDKARELMTNWVIPFAPPEQLTKWVKWVTIKAAVADSLDEIRHYEPTYLNRTCMHAEHQNNEARSRLVRESRYVYLMTGSAWTYPVRRRLGADAAPRGRQHSSAWQRDFRKSLKKLKKLT